MNEVEFKKEFQLDDDVVISNDAIEIFNRYVEGSKLLFNHLSDKINTHTFSITVDGRSFEFKPVKIFKRGNWDFVMSHDSNHCIELYVKNSSNFRTTCEWLSARAVNQNNFNRSVFEDNFDRESEDEFMIKLFRAAYRKYMDSELYDLINHYKKTHGVISQYRYFGVKYLYGVGASSPIRFSGVDFTEDIFVYKGDERVFINEYDIKKVIEKYF